MIHIPTEAGRLVVWRRRGSAEQLLARLTLSAAEQARYEKITHPARRAEWLAWHVMLRELLGKGVSADYNADGQPILVGHSGHISVSHSREWVALYHQPGRCGVDMEDLTRPFGTTTERFISPVERALPEAAENHFPPLVWGAKEAVYKYAGVTGLDFLRDIQLVRIDSATSQVHAILLESEAIVLKYRIMENHCLVYTTPCQICHDRSACATSIE